MSVSDAAPLPRLGEVFFDVRGNSRSMRLSWYADTGVAVFSIWQAGMCTGTFRLPMADLSRMIEILERGPSPQRRARQPVTGAHPADQRNDEYGPAEDEIGGLDSPGSPAASYASPGYGPAAYPVGYGSPDGHGQSDGYGRVGQDPAGYDEWAGGASARPQDGRRTSESGPAADYRGAGYGQGDYGAADHAAGRYQRDDYPAAGYQPGDYTGGHDTAEHGPAGYPGPGYEQPDYRGAGYAAGGPPRPGEYGRGENGRPEHGIGAYGGGEPDYLTGENSAAWRGDGRRADSDRDYFAADYESQRDFPAGGHRRDDGGFTPERGRPGPVETDAPGYRGERFVPPYVHGEQEPYPNDSRAAGGSYAHDPGDAGYPADRRTDSADDRYLEPSGPQERYSYGSEYRYR